MGVLSAAICRLVSFAMTVTYSSGRASTKTDYVLLQNLFTTGGKIVSQHRLLVFNFWADIHLLAQNWIRASLKNVASYVPRGSIRIPKGITETTVSIANISGIEEICIKLKAAVNVCSVEQIQWAHVHLHPHLFPISSRGWVCNFCVGIKGNLGPNLIWGFACFTCNAMTGPWSFGCAFSPGLGSIHFFQFNSIPIQVGCNIFQFNSISISIGCRIFQFKSNSIHFLSIPIQFNSNFMHCNKQMNKITGWNKFHWTCSLGLQLRVQLTISQHGSGTGLMAWCQTGS